jgi:hypothetical protein
MRWNAPHAGLSPFTIVSWGDRGLRHVVYEGAQMAASPRKRHLAWNACRALELLLDQRGTAEAVMLAHGFTERMLGRLVRAGLITIRHEMIRADAGLIEVGKVKITYSGRRALEG